MPVRKSDIKKYVVLQTEIAESFDFVEDQVLRNNIAIVFQYMLFLILLSEKHKFSGPFLYSIYKNIILCSATITESCLYYSIKYFLNKKKVKAEDVMSWSWKYSNKADLHEISSSEKVCAGKRSKKFNRFTDRITFIEMNRIALRARILTRKLFEKSESMRKKRNKIHLAALKKVDDSYSKKRLIKTLDDTIEIINHLGRKVDAI